MRTPPLTLSQFRVAIEIARAAAENDMPDLSRRAVAESLSGGLPVADPDFSNTDNQRQRYSSSRDSANTVDPIQIEVATSLREVLGSWKDAKKYPAKSVYELLCPLVFPESRPGEIMLYEDSTKLNDGVVKSLGAILVQKASDAKQLDNLLPRIEEREQNEATKVSAAVMKTLVQLHKKDWDSAHQEMVKLNELIDKTSVSQLVMLGCHAAIRASKHPELEKEAISILRKALDVQTATAGEENVPPLGKLASIVNQYLAKQGDQQAIRDFFEHYITSRQKEYSRYGGDYGMYMLKRDSAEIANAASEMGLTSVAMDFMGRVKDSTSTRYGSVANTDNVALKSFYELRKTDAAARFDKWKEWTMPTEGRQTVRMVKQWDVSKQPMALPTFAKRSPYLKQRNSVSLQISPS